MKCIGLYITKLICSVKLPVTPGLHPQGDFAVFIKKYMMCAQSSLLQHSNNAVASSFVALGSPFDGTYFVHAQSICTIALYSDKYAVETTVVAMAVQEDFQQHHLSSVGVLR